MSFSCAAPRARYVSNIAWQTVRLRAPLGIGGTAHLSGAEYLGFGVESEPV
jgi:hypothetical protein